MCLTSEIGGRAKCSRGQEACRLGREADKSLTEMQTAGISVTRAVNATSAIARAGVRGRRDAGRAAPAGPARPRRDRPARTIDRADRGVHDLAQGAAARGRAALGSRRAAPELTPGSVRRALATLVADPATMRAMGEKGRQRIASDWNYETEFAKVAARLSA